MKIHYFKTQKAFRDWLEKNHDKAEEIEVGFYKKSTKKSGITYAEALDEALCFGWIDGIRHSVDEVSYRNRFTPRKSRSNWSLVNIKHIQRLTAEGKMHSSGIAAYEARDKKNTGVYSFERENATLTPKEEKLFKANKPAWEYFTKLPPSYKRLSLHWVTSAKREDTRAKRLQTLIDDSGNGLRIKLLRR